MNTQISLETLLGKISKAEKIYSEYYDLVRETREYYKDSRKNGAGKYNIFWSSIETLKPFLYFKQPQVYVERTNRTASLVENTACRILEKALTWDLTQFDFDSIIKYARNDFLISGCGIVWEQYRPEFTELQDPEDENKLLSVKTGETVISSYVNPEYFLADCDKVGIWENVNWIARKIFMDNKELVRRFGTEYESSVLDKKEVCVYEVWHKPDKKVY